MRKTKKPAKKTMPKTPAKAVKKLVKKASKMPPPIEMVDDPEIDDISDKEYADSQKSYAALLKMRLAKQAERKAAKKKAAAPYTDDSSRSDDEIDNDLAALYKLKAASIAAKKKAAAPTTKPADDDADFDISAEEADAFIAMAVAERDKMAAAKKKAAVSPTTKPADDEDEYFDYEGAEKEVDDYYAANSPAADKKTPTSLEDSKLPAAERKAAKDAAKKPAKVVKKLEPKESLPKVIKIANEEVFRTCKRTDFVEITEEQLLQLRNFAACPFKGNTLKEFMTYLPTLLSFLQDDESIEAPEIANSLHGHFVENQSWNDVWCDLDDIFDTTLKAYDESGREIQGATAPWRG